MPTAPSTPPKRMTRARAAKAADTTDTKTPTTKIMTPAAKAAATRKTKRAAPPVEDEEDQLLAEAAANKTKNANATAGPAAAAAADTETTAKSASKRRGRANSKTQAPVEEKFEEPTVAKKGRGRPRKAAVVEELPEEPEPSATGRTSRTKQSATTPAAAAPRRPVNNKKVSFQEGHEAGKENVVPPVKKAVAATAEVITSKETGIRAKPTRRPAAGRVPAKPKAAPVVGPAMNPVLDLKLDSVNSRDELDDDEDEEKVAPSEKMEDVQDFARMSTPAKINASVVATKRPSPLKTVSISPSKSVRLPAPVAMSPKKGLASSLLGSPARRPPQSPLKNTLKDSPHKPSTSSSNLGQYSVNTPAKESMMSKSPKKFVMSTVERKPSVLAAPVTDFRRSLFASPPKRPFFPYKTIAPPSTMKSGLSLMSAMTAASHKPSPQVPRITPAKTMVASSAFSAQRSPTASAKVHKMTMKEREEMMELELKSAPSPFTPWVNKQAKTPKDHRMVYRNELKNAPAPFTPLVERPQFSRVTSTGSVSGSSKKSMQTTQVADETLSNQPAIFADDDNDKDERTEFERSTTPEGFPSEVVMQLATPSYGGDYRAMDFDSDDELQLTTSTAKLTITPKRMFEQQTPITQAPRTPSSYRRATLSSQNKAGTMTALANKFGDWKSATPDEKIIVHRRQEKALFSVAKPQKRAVPVTPVAARLAQTPRIQQQKGEMTALAQKFGDWEGASPDKKERNVQKSVFSPIKSSTAHAPRTPSTVHNKATPKTARAAMTVMADKFRVAQATPGSEIDLQSPEKQSYFDEAMAIMEDDHDMDIDSRPARESNFRISQLSEPSQLYGDENVSPVDEDELMLDVSEEQIVAAAPPPPAQSPLKAIITPARLHDKQPRVVHTITKVPLKPSAEHGESPSARPARRSHSLSGPISPQSAKDIRALREIPFRFDSSPVVPRTTQNLPTIKAPETPEQKQKPRTPSLAAAAPTPIRTPRPDINNRLLAGAIVFVDVHTTEGADASGIFVELLNAMGARCVKQWSWNPDVSLPGDANAMEGVEENRRVGITHVVFKDGGKRTMEKVRAAGGLVNCVGVAWVLE